MTTLLVTTELAPLLAGGAGVLVAELAHRLRAEGRGILVVLVTDAEVGELPLDTVHVHPGRPDPAAPSPYLAASRAAAAAVAELVTSGDVERVEFQDFYGLGWWALAHRDELELSRVPIAVRTHGPMDLIAEAMEVDVAYWHHVAQMERGAYLMADLVLLPSAGLTDLLVDRYRLDPVRTRVAEPPIVALPPVDRRPAAVPTFVAVGRLGEVKGSHDLLAAAVSLLDEGVDLRVRFVGEDSASFVVGGSMRDRLLERLPQQHAPRVSIEPAVPHAGLGAAIADAWAVVVASRFESFCLVAHEARRLGAPLVVADLPALRPYFSEATGALVYDRSVAGLADAMRRLGSDPALRDQLAAAPAPTVGDPLRAYRDGWVARHEREQRGAATAARAWLTATMGADAPRDERRAVARAAKWALRQLPEPLARAAMRLLPAGVKHRFRRLASWPQEAERRAAAQRRAAVEARIASGAFPEIERPDVTVVVPCFNQGAWLHDALRSVFEQDYDSFEIVVVDDGSTDPGTRRVLDRLSLPRTRVLRQANKGLPGARNAGIAAGRGQLIVPLDADDELAPGFLERMVAALDGAPGAGYAHCWARLFGDQDAVWVPAPYNPYRLLLSNCVNVCVVLRRDAWAEVGGYDEQLVTGSEDWDLWIRLSTTSWGEVAVREPLFRYRRHGVSMAVEKEARFERLREQLRDRNPAAYAPAVVRARKAASYPWVSVLVGADADLAALEAQTLDDAELVPVGAALRGLDALSTRRGWTLAPPRADLGDAVAASNGKLLVSWDHITQAAPDALSRLAAALEDVDDAAGACGDGGAAGPVVWRRWSLLDPEGPSGAPVRVPVALDATAVHGLGIGAFPAPGWSIALDPPVQDPPVPVLRQRPEEAGPLPAWLAPTGTRSPA